jgi:23S rRNA (guanosine2251-2'-O)-methyltransferase
MSPGRTPPRKPSGAKPAARKPTGAKPAARRPAGAKSAARKPTGSKPTGPKPAGAKSTRKPTGAKLVPGRSARTRMGVSRSQAAGRTGGARVGGGMPGGRDLHPARGAKGLGGEQVEGRQAVRELLLAGRRKVREIVMASELVDDEAVADIVGLARHHRVTITPVSNSKLDFQARSEAPQGVIAFAAPLPEADINDLVRGRGGRAPFLVAIDGVTDPGNLGAILRNCDGAGVDGVLVPRHRAVHVTPTVAKASAGAVEHVPIALVGGLPTTLAMLRDRHIWVVGLDDAADRSLFELGDLATDGICLVLGAEGAGLSRLVRERCDVVVSIPMRGRISSLNVSAAAALATYEVARQRAG